MSTEQLENKTNFFGTGWQFPPVFSNRGMDVATVTQEAAVHQSMRIMLTTSMGERIMRTQYGCDLFAFQFEEMSQRLITGIRKTVEDAIGNHEPRVMLNDVVIRQDPFVDGLLIIEVNYTVKATNSRFNLVYPFYLKEGIGVNP
jgi:uncharacterized protein